MSSFFGATIQSTLPADLPQLIKEQEKTQRDLVEAMKAGSQVVFACYKHKDFNVVDPHWTSVGLDHAVLSNVIHRFAPCEPPIGFPDLKFVRKYVPLKDCTGIAAFTAFDFLVEVSFGEDHLTHLKNKVYLTVEQVNLNQHITKQFNDWYTSRKTRATLLEYRTKLHMNPVVNGQFSALEDYMQDDDQYTYQYVCDRLSQGTPPSLISVDMFQTYNKVMSEKIKQKHAIADKLHQMKLDIIKSGVRGDSCATQVKLPEPQKLYPAIMCRPPEPKPTPTPEVNYQENRKRFAGITLATPAFLLFFATIGNIVSMTVGKVDFPSTASCVTSVLTHALWLFVSLFLFGRYLIITKGEGTESKGPR